MKTLSRILASIFLIILLLVLGLFITGNEFLVKGVWATYLHGEKTATIDDDRFFETRTVAANNPEPWPIHKRYNAVKLSDELNSTLQESESVAFVVVKNDKLLFEQYWDGYSDTSHSNSFSMTKSIITILTEIAIEQGYIKSWNEKVNTFLPELEGPYANDLELWHLSTMTAGLQWNEHYTNPFDITARAYYGNDIASLIYREVPVVNKPGDTYNYQSGAPQLLGLVLSKATGKTVSEFASEVLWSKIGAMHDASWHLDNKDGNELTYCCFNSNARDFARLGKLMLNYGNWDGNQILDSTFVAKAGHGVGVDYYGWSFWIYNDLNTPIYYFRGILGQYIIVFPEKDLVVCRLGKRRLEDEDNHPKDFKVIARESLKYFGY
ncbi:penicillin-binding protein, beta-lactamase class C [Owenweeksia hongkongensis DSM 17368]|uniref:Penicillin-binding protein, beta-lactamase class C n=1 Tax=Owenweeksia hongkongensis (strain DSM 17368 / CIP 108786 / JCM 12287 / NRRL B-23963 / UST20020801) TaxID=926562 RepID=G8R8D3_OWEHD|nr:serine hydrolase [Owenweeksia hongkongensis]AEV33526.1 penicillin-binding protein, beta-lactamase class C [Owenweeksia hongkongensis DSM 17368]